MMISGYNIEQTIFESSRTLIYRARRETDSRPVILKCLRQEYPTPQEIARFKLEYEITRSLKLPGVVNIYNLERYGNSFAISMEDFGGEALSKTDKPFDLAEFVSLAIQITAALGQVHQKHIIHKDINPSNIIYNPADGRIKLMKIVIENAGAQKSYLILNKDGDWSVEDSGAVRHDDVAVLQSIPLAIAGHGRTPILSAAVINYVRRTKRHVVLDDAAHEDEFMHDPYIVTAQPKSVLCMPLLHQGEMTGILYLENNLTSGAFTPDQVEIMGLLGGQAAISITNAQAIVARTEQERLQVQKEAIYQAAHLFNVSDNLPDLFQAIVDSVAAALPAYAVALIILDRQKETIAHFVKGGQGAGQIDTISYRELQEGLSGWVLQRLEPALSLKGKPDPRESLIARERRLQRGIGAIIVTPIHHRGVILGTMTTMNRRDQPDFTPSDMDLMQAISVQAAVAIENANLYADLQTSEKKYRRLFEDSKDMIFITTPAGEIVDVNPACFDLFGYTQSEALARKAQDFYADPAIRQQFRVKIEQDGMVRDFEAPIKHRDGSIKDCLLTATLRRADGAVEWVEAGGLPLGVEIGLQLGYEEKALNLNRGDTVILTSDGVIEANNAAGQMFGFDRLEQVVAAAPHDGVGAMLAHLQAEVARFVDPTEPHDDLTIVVIQV